MKSLRLPSLLVQISIGVASTATLMLAQAQVPLADQPVFSSVSVPGNVALALSVEFPTAVSVAHTGNYSSANTYLGYFDQNKCYLYKYDADETKRHFYPDGLASSRTCTGKWSGNFLNWATMQTIDPFRWALTGGYRSTDNATETILEKAWASASQGSETNFPHRTTTGSTTIKGATPFDWSDFKMGVRNFGNQLRFTQTGSVTAAGAPTAYESGSTPAPATVWTVSVRVKVCDSSAAAGGLESNCTKYPAGNYKPTGLIQQYSEQIRFSAFGYLNDGAVARDGGVLRAKQKFVGPSQPVPGSTPVANALGEWDANNGVMITNPNPLDAAATLADFGVTVGNSGVMNYLNKFGQITKAYKTYDPVGELHYAAVRYFKNLGNVPEWTSMSSASAATKTTWIDGFPVITKWDDPIQYSCQKNFIIGIGDANTHADRNLPGATGSSEPTKPAAVSSDTTVDALAATNKVGTLHGIADLGSKQPYGGCCTNNGALMAGVAYDANAKDIRPDFPNRQTVQTYWLDVLEGGYKANNQFYLAAKYGGFTVPEIFDPYARTTDLDEAWWYTSTNLVSGQKQPDNYFTAAKPDLMVSGLSKAFASIAAKLKANSTSLSAAAPQITESGSAVYAAQYDSKTWTGELIAYSSKFDSGVGRSIIDRSMALLGQARDRCGR